MEQLREYFKPEMKIVRLPAEDVMIESSPDDFNTHGNYTGNWE